MLLVQVDTVVFYGLTVTHIRREIQSIEMSVEVPLRGRTGRLVLLTSVSRCIVEGKKVSMAERLLPLAPKRSRMHEIT